MKLLPALLLATLAAVSPLAAADSYDIVVYGGSSGGITAAIQAARMGKTAVLIEPTKFLGGLTTGGLGATDIGNKKAIGGMSREFYANVFQYYADPAKWKQQTRERILRQEAPRQHRQRGHHVDLRAACGDGDLRRHAREGEGQGHRRVR
jgi:flavin-dependent dehydrogenase